jgi:hypothetical protein
MDICIFSKEIEISVDTIIALIALIISVVSLGLSFYFWRKSFRPIVTATVRTHSAGNGAIAYDLVFLNSGTIPAKHINIKATESSLSLAFGHDATPENKKRWLACFDDVTSIPILHSSDRVSCSFGTTKADEAGFWKYKSIISVVVEYEGWFGSKYQQPQEIQIVDSGSFTGFMWAGENA